MIAGYRCSGVLELILLLSVLSSQVTLIDILRSPPGNLLSGEGRRCDEYKPGDGDGGGRRNVCENIYQCDLVIIFLHAGTWDKLYNIQYWIILALILF